MIPFFSFRCFEWNSFCFGSLENSSANRVWQIIIIDPFGTDFCVCAWIGQVCLCILPLPNLFNLFRFSFFYCLLFLCFLCQWLRMHTQKNCHWIQHSAEVTKFVWLKLIIRCSPIISAADADTFAQWLAHP